MLIYQIQDGYCYNSDSLFLYNFISMFNPKKRVLDVGSGSGVLGLLIKRDFPNITLEAVEIQASYAELSQKSAYANRLEYRVHNVNLLDFKDEKGFEYIISNPPFYHDETTHSSSYSKSIARFNIHLPRASFFKKVSQLLKTNGHFIFCYDSAQFGLICAELADVKLRVVDVQFVHSKKGKNSSIVLVHVRKNSKSMMKVHTPLYAFENSTYSKDAQAIYDKARTHSIKCQI